MRRIFSLVFSLVFLFTTTSFAQARGEISYLDFLEKKGAISKIDKKTLNNFVSKANFWKAALITAGYQESSSKKKIFITPIKGISPNKWYSEYARVAYKNGLLNKYKGKEVDPLTPIRKLEALGFVFGVFGISSPLFNDVIMDYKDVQNDHPIVSKCLQIGLCKGETNFIFGANKPLTKTEAYTLIAKAYKFINETPGANGTVTGNELGLLEEVFYAIIRDYYKASDLDGADLIYSAAEGLTEAVGDKYTKFMRPIQSSNFNETLDQSFEGIGAYIEADLDGVKIVTPINGSPAKAAGLKTGDVILEADGIILRGLDLREAISYIKGPKGTIVKLKILRGNKFLDFNVKRGSIKIPSVESRIEDGLLIIKINQFGKNTDKELLKILNENSSFKSIIFDLRHNPGGYLNVAENILSMFVKTGDSIVKVKYPAFISTTKSKNLQKIVDKKIVILIDEASASASEIFAATMQDYGLAQLVGTSSYGKGTVQTILEFVDGSQLKYTIANWLSGKGRLIQDIGVEPDFKVLDNPDKFGDEILNKGKSLLK